MYTRSFTTLHSVQDDKKETSEEKDDTNKQRAKQCCVIRLASLFCREAEVLFGALKTKSCLSVSEFFLFSGEKCWSRQKSAALIFSFVTFLLYQDKRKSKYTQK